jgi:hypothetical protein
MGRAEAGSFPMPQKKNRPDKRQDKDEPQLWWDPNNLPAPIDVHGGQVRSSPARQGLCSRSLGGE